jgi:very-short-patch-repair endonuclease
MSVSEQALWLFLRKKRLGFLFRRQYPVGMYVLDFYCPEARLCVEVDGEQHRERVQADAQRDEFLAARGIETLRIPSLDLFEPTGQALKGWLQEVVMRCERRSGRPCGLQLPKDWDQAILD